MILEKIALAAKEHFFFERCFFEHATAAFCPCYLPAIQAFVRMGRTGIIRFRLALHKFPAVHLIPPHMLLNIIYIKLYLIGNHLPKATLADFYGHLSTVTLRHTCTMSLTAPTGWGYRTSRLKVTMMFSCCIDITLFRGRVNQEHPYGGPAMIIKITYLLLLSFFLSACAQTVSTFSLGVNDALPKSIYTQYQYSSGASGRLRAVLLKNPESDIEIIPYSVQIETTKGSLDDAYNFLDRRIGHRHISVQGVRYQGKTIGYLMVPEKHMFSRDEIWIILSEKNGKVYFSVFERTYND